MKAIIGVYESHTKALEAVNALKQAGYAADKLSIIGKADLINDHIHVVSNKTPEKVEMSIGVLTGTVLGVLTGVGVFAIPGLGFLFGAGALVGAFAGLDLGIIGGGLVAILTNAGIDEANAIKYEKHLNEGNFIVFAQGDEKQIKHAHEVLHNQNLHLELAEN